MAKKSAPAYEIRMLEVAGGAIFRIVEVVNGEALAVLGQPDFDFRYQAEQAVARLTR